MTAPSPADAVRALARLGAPAHSGPGVARRAGADCDVADRLWRALGFRDVPDDELAFTDDDARVSATHSCSSPPRTVRTSRPRAPSTSSRCSAP